MNDPSDRHWTSSHSRRSTAGVAYFCAVLALLILTIAAMPHTGESAPVTVRFPEGLTHRFLLVRSAGGEIVGHGGLTQVVGVVRFEGPLQLMGPVVSIELISPQVAPHAEDLKHAPH